MQNSLVWPHKQHILVTSASQVEVGKARQEESKKLSKATFKILVALDFKTQEFPTLSLPIRWEFLMG